MENIIVHGFIVTRRDIIAMTASYQTGDNWFKVNAQPTTMYERLAIGKLLTKLHKDGLLEDRKIYDIYLSN